MIENFASIFILAIFVEGTVEYFFSNPEKKQPWLKYVSLLVAVGVCFAAKANLFDLLGVQFVSPVIGYLLTGVVISRGSNYINDFIGRVRNPVAAVQVQPPATVKADTVVVQDQKIG